MVDLSVANFNLNKSYFAFLLSVWLVRDHVFVKALLGFEGF